jgi:hypothetical protein
MCDVTVLGWAARERASRSDSDTRLEPHQKCARWVLRELARQKEAEYNQPGGARTPVRRGGAWFKLRMAQQPVHDLLFPFPCCRMIWRCLDRTILACSSFKPSLLLGGLPASLLLLSKAGIY